MIRAAWVWSVMLLVTGGWTSPTPTPTVAPVTSVPVLLVPGWLDSDRDLAALRIRLIGAGWPAEYVKAVAFDEPTGSSIDHAHEIAAAARSLMERAESETIDIVAHSMGGLATRAFLNQEGAPYVRRVVFVATPHQGTYAAFLAFGEGRDEMMPGSSFLEELNSRPALPESVEAITIRTPIDTHILPAESATLPGVPDHVVCCPTHAGLLRDLDVFRIIRRFLTDGTGPEGP